MPEYRAFDKKGSLVSQDNLADTDSAVAWAITVTFKGAALYERWNGEDWECFREWQDKHPAAKG